MGVKGRLGKGKVRMKERGGEGRGGEVRCGEVR